MLFPSSRRARDRGGALKCHVGAATVCATKPVIFVCFEKKPAAFVWPRRSNMVLPRTWTKNLLHFAPSLHRVIYGAPDFEELQM